MKKKKKKILIATDGSDFGTKAVDEACDYIDPNRAEVKVVSAYFPTIYLGTEPGIVQSSIYTQIEKDLRNAATDLSQSRLSNAGIPEITFPAGMS